MGNAVYRDLIRACVMAETEVLILAVPNKYKYKSSGHETVDGGYIHARGLADVLYGHGSFRLPYKLLLIGY